jgi:hypothetical protein
MSSPEMVNFNHPLEGSSRRRKNFLFTKSAFVLLFIFIFGLLLLTTVYRSVAFPFLGSLTGRVVGIFSSPSDTSNYFPVSMNLTIPELNLKGDYERIILSVTSNTPLILGNSEFDLKKEGFTQIILEGFSGEINLDENGINLVDGKAVKVTVNGISFSNKNGKPISILTNSFLNYEFVEFREEIRFKKLSYVASGNIYWGDNNLLRLNSEDFEIINFFGSIILRNKIINFEGVVENLKSKNFKLK